MKMRYCICGVIVLMLLLTGCNGAQPQEDSSNGMTTNETTLPNPEIVTYAISQWIPFEGEIDHVENVDLLPRINTESKDGLLNYGSIEYKKLELPEEMYERPITSGWRIQLKELSPVGILESGGIVLMPNCTNSPVLCFYYESSDNLLFFLKSDFGEDGICSLELDDFDIYADGCIIPKDERIEHIWNMHTGKDTYQTGYLPLDGNWKYYSLRLVYKECPTLQYEMNLVLINDFLYIENLQSKELACIPIKHFVG